MKRSYEQIGEAIALNKDAVLVNLMIGSEPMYGLDISWLSGKRWFTSSLIEAFSKVVSLEYPLVRAVHPYCVRWDDDRDIRVNLSFFRSVPESARVIFVPVNIKNSHWALITVDLDACCLRYYDSLRKPTKPPSLIFEKLIEHFGDDEWRAVRVECPQQPNGYDCGAYICYFMDQIAKTRSNLVHDPSTSSLREMIRERLLKYKVEEEVITLL